MKININAFLKQFAKEYKFLYEHRDNVAGFDEAVKEFDRLLSVNKSFGDLVGEFVVLRRDVLASDREAAAFMFALDALGGLA